MKLSHIVRILLILVLAYFTDDSVCLEGLNVCVHSNGREYCCANYEDKKGKCIECNIGFYSIKGQPCIPCKKNRFGHRCVASCNCNSLQNCDSIKGCVPKVKDVTAFETTDSSENITNAVEIIKGFSKDHLLIYSLVATSIIFAVGTCFVCRRIQKKKARREVTANETTSPPSQITNYGNQTYLSTEGNSLMNNTFTHKSIGPFIETEESRSQDQLETDNDDESNLHAYNSILKPESNSVTEDRPQKPFQTFRESLAESTENITNHLDH